MATSRKTEPESLTDRLEEHLARSSAECARVLGVGYSTYMNYKKSDIPESMQNHIDVILRLPLDVLHLLVKERLHGG